MKQKTKTATKRPAKTTTKTTPTAKQTTAKKSEFVTLPASVYQDAITMNDFRNALLIVSLLINLFIFTTWLVMQVTTQYDAEIAAFLFQR